MITKIIPVATLLSGGACGVICTKAVFAETLHVDALATDSWSVLEYLDHDGVPKAFALEPASSETGSRWDAHLKYVASRIGRRCGR